MDSLLCEGSEGNDDVRREEADRLLLSLLLLPLLLLPFSYALASRLKPPTCLVKFDSWMP